MAELVRELHRRGHAVTTFASGDSQIVPSSWPEPFGLVVIEALACGTPVLARRAGAIPEILRDGIDGFIGDDAQQLAFFDGLLDGPDRAAIRAGALERFSVAHAHRALPRHPYAQDPDIRAWSRHNDDRKRRPGTGPRRTRPGYAPGSNGNAVRRQRVRGLPGDAHQPAPSRGPGDDAIEGVVELVEAHLGDMDPELARP